MIKFHPRPEQLTEFAQGGLSPVESIMISAHCDMCTRCQTIVRQEAAMQAEQLLYADASMEEQPAELRQQFDTMLSQITSLDRPLRPAPSATTSVSSALPAYIELEGRQFVVPKTLRKFVSGMGNWSSLVGHLWQAPIELNTGGAANFIFMGQGGTVPEHTHKGSEYTLVLDGHFSDGINHYQAGDLIYMDGNKTHTPRSDDINGCLVFSILDQPLHFTSGLARLLNPFSQLFFR